MAPYPWGQGTYPGNEYVSTPYRVQNRRVLLSLWRNRLARSAVNRKVGGSSPPRDGGGAILGNTKETPFCQEDTGEVMRPTDFQRKSTGVRC